MSKVSLLWYFLLFLRCFVLECRFAASPLRRFAASPLRRFAASPLRRFAASPLALWFCLSAAQAQEWFPPGHVECSLFGASINLGIFSRITDPVPAAEGSFNVNCSSNAYPAGYPASYRTAEGGYCLNIAGARVLKGQGKNAGIEIPFDFFNSTRKQYDPNRPQDFTTPIGDGTWGIAFFDWDYHDGIPDRGTPPWAGGLMVLIPVKSYFRMQVKPYIAGRVYPAGIYSGNFTFNWTAGEVRQAGTFPKVTEGPGICSRWQGMRGSGAVNVKLEIKKYCYVKVNKNIEFDKQIMLNKPLTERGEIEADCSEGTSFGIGIDKGQNSERAGGRRAMRPKGGEDIILYDLYKNQALTERWGSDWGSDASIQRGTGSGEGQQFPVWASVPPQGAKSKGIYQDTVIVEIRVLDPGGL